MKDQVYHEYKGEDNCPWSLVQMKAAFKTYMRSKRASEKRSRNDQNSAHVILCRRQNRKREKLGRRLKSLDSKTWNAAKKAEVADVMRVDYMSSEESDLEDGSPVYLVKPLVWESSDLKKRKRSLDKHHRESLPSLVRRRVIRRKEGPPSLRNKPASCPEWACQQ
ncbi:uncharacterized protein LOC110243926 [Exaiptasia diaphana]|uniref:Uncharacterized protein n=1 Tax=Exaiptasia diaphana TaxID=2652724 RepID=A0A913YQ46_EXADI|nr:uncharacterized protein LOC110243926 [Exaiptasia diaphana]